MRLRTICVEEIEIENCPSKYFRIGREVLLYSESPIIIDRFDIDVDNFHKITTILEKYPRRSRPGVVARAEISIHGTEIQIGTIDCSNEWSQMLSFSPWDVSRLTGDEISAAILEKFESAEFRALTGI